MTEVVARILVVAATARELAPASAWRVLRCGVGPVEAAATTATAIAEDRPSLILHVGIAGARRARGLAPGTVIVGTESRYCDLPENIPPEWASRSVVADPALVAAVQRAAPGAMALPIGTSARVGGTTGHAGCDVEAMEGFGVLRAAQLAGVPAVEVRVVSNEIEEPDRARWRFDEAFASVIALTPRLVAELLSCVR